MYFQPLIVLVGMVTLISAAALHPARQEQSTQSAPPQGQCPAVTTYIYITVTVTDIPDVVTIAIPDYSSISKSLASASTIDSLVVVENSQNRPVNAPPNTVTPTFVHSINAPAVEVTEAPHDGTSVYYLPGTRSPYTIVIGKTTESIILSPIGTPAAAPSAGHAVSDSTKTFPVPPSGWNGTGTNSTNISALSGTGRSTTRNSTATSTETTYVATTTVVVNTTITTVPSGESTSQYNYPGYNSYVKRQTCVLISAEIDGSWASWCNNWDGSTTYTYTSWETTVTPETIQTSAHSTNPSSSTTFTSTQSSITTVAFSGTPVTSTVTMIPASQSDNTQPSSSAAPAQSSSPPSCGETGPFSISFDDLPKQSVFDNETAGLPPIFNPFEHFYWADSWSYLPPPNDPYPPHDGSQLAIYVPPAGSSTTASPDADTIPPGGFGAGPRSSNDAYWFNIRSAWVGCENNATDPSNTCDFVAEGYRYDSSASNNRLIITKHYFLPLCHTASCQLQQVFFSDQFTQLAAISFYAKIGGSVRAFYMDDMQLNWWNNTCEAGTLRASRKT